MAWLTWDFCPIVQQLARLFSFWHAWHVCNILVACSREPPVRSNHKSLLLCTILSNSSHSHTLLLHDSHLNTGLLIAKIQANLARNKANKMVDKIQLYTKQSDSRIQLACQLFSKLGSMHFFPNPLTNSQKSTNCFYHRLMDWWYCVHLHSEVLS